MKHLVSPAGMRRFEFGASKGSHANILDGGRFGMLGMSAMIGDVRPGDRVPLHRHAYDELFVVNAGAGVYLIDGCEIEAARGDVVLIPAGVPHAVENRGQALLQHTAFHDAAEVAIEWLEPPT